MQKLENMVFSAIEQQPSLATPTQKMGMTIPGHSDLVLTPLSMTGIAKRYAKLTLMVIGTLFIIPAIIFAATGLYMRAVQWVYELHCGHAIHRKVQGVALATLQLQPEPIPQLSKEELLSKARVEACTLQVLNWNLPQPQEMQRYISEIRKHLALLPSQTLKELYTPHLEDISKLQKVCQRKFDSFTVWCLGRDCVNRSFLTIPEVTQLLQKPEIVKAILALSVVTKIYNPELHEKLVVCQQYGLTLDSMLEMGFKSNTAFVLECLPTNDTRNLQKEAEFLSEYIRKKAPENTFIPLMKAVQSAYHELTGQPVDTIKKQPPSATDYKLHGFQSLAPPLLNKMVQKLSAADTSEKKEALVKNAGNWSLRSLQTQARGMIKTFCMHSQIAIIEPPKKNEYAPKWLEIVEDPTDYTIQMTFQEFIRVMSVSHFWLHPDIAHNSDRIHMIAALFDEEACVKFIDGQHSMKEIYLSVIDLLIRDPLPEQAIAAEQLYARLLLILRDDI